MNLPSYDEVYVVSDLHMGGESDFQILRGRECRRLAGFIRRVAQQRPEGKTALVLNGDVIDTLAEKGSDYIAVDNAQAVVQRIMADPAFAQIWDALAALVRTANRTLIIILGNHDLELSLPLVQHTISERLTASDSAPRGRIEFSTMGAGYTCLVGGRRVFITHGNEVDAWNYVRYEDLARAARRLNSGRPLTAKEWEPNAGTMLVKQIMNEIKRTYRWIDLLKPEVQAALGVLIAIDPGQAEKLRNILPVIGERVVGQAEVDQRLSVTGFGVPAAGGARPVTLDSLLGPNLLAAVSQKRGDQPRADEMLRRAEENFGNFQPKDYSLNQPLGTWQYVWDRITGWLTGVSKEEALRRALLDWLRGDQTFVISNQDDTFKEVLGSIGPDIDFIITGHTHLERAIDAGGGRYYFNCGTWIRLLCFTKEMLNNEESFKPVYHVLEKGSMEAIDQASFNNAPLVLDRSSAVRIRAENGATVGELLHILNDGNEQQSVLQFVKG